MSCTKNCSKHTIYKWKDKIKNENKGEIELNETSKKHKRKLNKQTSSHTLRIDE
jgi:uncharacterized protein involved in tolerance to divalent cations